MLKSELTLKQRLLATSIYILLLELLSGFATGIWIPTEGGKSLWFFSAIGLYFFTHLSSPFFAAPRDSLAASSTSALVLATVDLGSVSLLAHQLNMFRWGSFLLATSAAISALAAIVLYGTDPIDKPKLAVLSRITYRLSDSVGRGQIMFSPLVLISIVGFYQGELIQQMWLLFGWAVLIFVEPVDLLLKLIDDLSKVGVRSSQDRLIGEIQRIDDPNIIRVRLNTVDTWKRDKVHVVHMPDSRQVEVLPLFVQLQEAELIGTGLSCKEPSRTVEGSSAGCVYHIDDSRSADELLKEICGEDPPAELIGFVVENSEIAKICFEVSSEVHLEEGWLVFVRQRAKHVYYQILDARTKEESFSQNPRGTQIVFADQLGTLDAKKGFLKYGWLPSMNSPVFLSPSMAQVRCEESDGADDFILGFVPNSNIPVRASFSDMIEYHTAILGVTGTGKTELALDIIRHALSQDTKVFCVDFTGEYRHRLADANPEYLGLDPDRAKTLQERLFDVETGQFSAGDEKKALGEFIDEITPEILREVDEFLQPEGPRIGIFEIEEIANTKATLRATELYLSTLFDWARRNRRKRRILLVLEEAHTIVPETNLFGFDRVETSAVVGRMAQISLQGRKYGVGILLVSQRTALVSKTLLSQSNTVFSFTLHDQTGLNYLGNVFSSDYVSVIPNLKFLQGVAFGKAVRSDRPIVFEIPWDEDKKKASQALDESEEEVPGDQTVLEL
ncbi:MAG TPA: DUF87 domain-containing protein [Anaerolineae bacterium]|nr:DUF87 domain-containing protein [Anaerolineae bacterium]